MMKEQVRPIYSELQGYLSQAPAGDKGLIFEASIWEQHNQTIDELNTVTGKNYDRYKVEVRSIDWNRTMRRVIDSQSYRIKLGGLISRLHGEYFSDEPPPFSGMPSTVITQHQIQNQATYVQILLDLQSKIDEKLQEYKEESKEKTFLEKIKNSLSRVGNIVELIGLILRTGKELGLTVEQILKMFS
ncbi:MAG: hypothetical protein COY73_03760 [Candidatus Nealsonbacteria bacterium CG_4_10_14_0_8_um_filter_37_14]|uniref:Uncharacterized protein n=1 Tax=Candidatus Nealsonbacteria bacterium CG_4_10_14_0_8_um_filter_37_14 TaxID=1974684 RepID=A0A2M7R6K3_9BACT|nr:MAG: hypothetical protein COY73_03760 [Candidatus Nealsonbacteria bacterium CG_4_10_14_0_8_um_filter_37_14]